MCVEAVAEGADGGYRLAGEENLRWPLVMNFGREEVLRYLERVQCLPMCAICFKYTSSHIHATAESLRG